MFKVSKPPLVIVSLAAMVLVLWGCGGYLLEFLDLEALAADKVYEFLFVATPLRLAGGIGSPIVPLAII